MTDLMVKGISTLHYHHVNQGQISPDGLGPDIGDPAIGRPITHAQVITLSKLLKELNGSRNDVTASCHLDDLLRGSKIFYEPPKPKAEPTTEHSALMARLRREEEARAYERMINPPLSMESFEQRFPNSSNSKLFSGNQAQADDDDEVTYADVNRQMALIINILVSIVACSIALWLVASRWNTPSRLALSMGGSILVAVAEAVVYAGYLRRVKEARKEGKKEIEIKEVVKTWVIGDYQKSSPMDPPHEVVSKEDGHEQLRRRNVKPG
ncbi:MAG: hypothetical protein Q9170_001432 [Blastenia crenularia]